MARDILTDGRQPPARRFVQKRFVGSAEKKRAAGLPRWSEAIREVLGFMRKVEVVPHDSRWRGAFEAEAGRVAEALGENVVAVHHIGSTAIPGIYAKPVVDLLVEVRDINEVDGRSSAMGSLGYEVMGEYGIPGRRYFRKDDRDGVRTHQVHAFGAGSAEAVRHLAFRDYMIAHPEEARRYSELKRGLAAEHPLSIDGYMDGKDDFIKEMDRRAARWRASRAG